MDITDPSLFVDVVYNDMRYRSLSIQLCYRTIKDIFNQFKIILI